MTLGDLRSRLDYDPLTGRFVWKTGQRANSVAGFLDEKCGGYLRVVIDRKRFLLHRVAWFYVHGTWPANTIDHINRDRTDNRIANLRDVSIGENLRNTATRSKPGRLGVMGVRQSGSRYRAEIYRDGRTVSLGRFDSIAEAAAAYATAKNFATARSDKHEDGS